jgi:hypothetical protein
MANFFMRAILLIGTNKLSMMVQVIFLTMKQSVFSREHGQIIRGYVVSKPFQMAIFSKVLIKKISFMGLGCSTIILAVAIVMRGSSKMARSTDKERKTTSQGVLMRGTSKII